MEVIERKEDSFGSWIQRIAVGKVWWGRDVRRWRCEAGAVHTAVDEKAEQLEPQTQHRKAGPR